MILRNLEGAPRFLSIFHVPDTLSHFMTVTLRPQYLLLSWYAIVDHQGVARRTWLSSSGGDHIQYSP